MTAQPARAAPLPEKNKQAMGVLGFFSGNQASRAVLRNIIGDSMDENTLARNR